MKHYKSINKLYYNHVLKNNIDIRPIFIVNTEDEYIVFRDRYNTINKFNNHNEALSFVNRNYYNIPIITIDLKK